MKSKDEDRSDGLHGSEGIDLAQFDEDFARIEVEERKFEPIPDGKYQVNVENAELTKAKISGNPMLKWTLRILDPPYRGRLRWRNNLMVTQENIHWLKKDLCICGLDLAKLSDLPENVERLINVRLMVTKRTRNGNENIFFNKRIEPETERKDIWPKDDDDIPF
jgi:hypothetical protein